MKKKLLLLVLSIFLLASCDFKEDFSDRNVYTTIYPIEYATDMLYSEYGHVASVYPNSATKDYELTEKKKKTYSDAEIFVYSGLSGEATLARDLINLNNKIKIVDATKGMNNQDIASVWLDPSNYLMLCSNIKSTLIDYTDNVYTKEEIDQKYKELNEKISELDVQLYDIGKSGNYNTILTANNVFNHLTKYNINVISLDSKNDQIDKAYSDAKKLINDKKIQYFYYLEGTELNQQQEKLINDYSLVKIEINDIYSLTDEERKEDKNYISIMNEIIDNYKLGKLAFGDDMDKIVSNTKDEKEKIKVLEYNKKQNN